MKINVIGGQMAQKEIEQYINIVNEKFPEKRIKNLDLVLDGEYVDLKYEFEDVPFERIRRITGYLVGTVDRFNDAKRSEESQRVKHNIGCSCSGEEF